MFSETGVYNNSVFSAERCNHQQMSAEQLQLCTKVNERVIACLFLELFPLLTHRHYRIDARRFRPETNLKLL